jgi:hypothetical protein
MYEMRPQPTFPVGGNSRGGGPFSSSFLARIGCAFSPLIMKAKFTDRSEEFELHPASVESPKYIKKSLCSFADVLYPYHFTRD